MIGDYIGFYQNQTEHWGCTYLNIRSKYLQNIPKFYNSYPGHSWARRYVMPRFQVTTGEPGEHPNFRGASKDAQQWANQIFTWFYANCSDNLPLGSDDDYYL